MEKRAPIKMMLNAFEGDVAISLQGYDIWLWMSPDEAETFAESLKTYAVEARKEGNEHGT